MTNYKEKKEIVNKLVSIIVPVFNTEQYLNRCINSLLNQTYKNFEIIIINDGSIDESERIIKVFNDKRIKYHFQENYGVSHARNKGIEFAKGEYICFVDSDDYVNEKYLEMLIDSSINNMSDLSICEYNIIENNSIKKTMHIKEDNYEGVLINALKKETIYFSLLNKIFDKKIIIKNKIKFIEDVFNGEDMEFVIHYLNCIKKVSFVKVPLYNYCRHNGSASYNRKIAKKFNNDWLTEEIAICEISKYINKNNRKYISVLYTDYCSHILDLLVYFKIYDERYKHCLKLLRKNIIKSITFDNENIKNKIKLIILSINPIIFQNK